MLELGSDLFARLNAGQSVGNLKPAVYGEGGMSATEIASLQGMLGFPPPPDFIYLLQHVVDPGEVLFDYRNFQRREYDERIAWVVDGILFDVSEGIWHPIWGERPADPAKAVEIVRRDLITWPHLLPLYSHRFLVAEPCRSDNPVLSIMQFDIICYGANLAHYLVHEFLSGEYADQPILHVPKWSDILE